MHLTNTTLEHYNLNAVQRTHTHIFGTALEPRYIFGAAARRIVSCYTLFKGWLPLSQPPICLWAMTTFNTERGFGDLR